MYIIQMDQFSCGPIAFINAKKWQGFKVSYNSDYRKIRKLCHCEPPNGTPEKYQKKIAKKFGFRRLFKPTVRKIDKLLLAGYAIQMRSLYYKDEEFHGHLYVITRRTERSFYCINYSNIGHRWVLKKEFKHEDLKRFGRVRPFAWIIPNVENN